MKTTDQRIQECFDQFHKLEHFEHFKEVSFEIEGIPLGDMMDLENRYNGASAYSKGLNVKVMLKSFHEGRCLIYFYSEPVAQHVQYTPLTENLTA